MKTAHALMLALLIGPAGCDRFRTSAKGDDGGPTTAASGGSDAAAPAKASSDLSLLAGFEGEIDVTVKGKTSSSPMPLALLVKNDVVRVDLPPEATSAKEARAFAGGGKVYLILKATEKTLTAVLDAKRQAVLINLDQVGDQVKSLRHAPAGGQDAPPPDPPKVVKTGTKEMVAGYACEDWDIISGDKSKVTACVADKGASFFHLPLTGIPTEHAWALELLDGKHFPLRAVAFDRDGTEGGRVEVTKLDRRTLDGAQFDVPPGYKVMSLQEALMGLGALPPGDVPPVPSHRGPHGRPHHGKK